MSTEMPCGRWTDSPTYHRTNCPTCYAEEYAEARREATTPNQASTPADTPSTPSDTTRDNARLPTTPPS